MRQVIPKRHTFPTVLPPIITPKSYNNNNNTIVPVCFIIYSTCTVFKYLLFYKLSEVVLVGSYLESF